MNRVLKRNSLLRIFNSYLYDSLLPLNINYLYNGGSLLGLCLIIQIVTGILLAMFYIPSINLAFDSVEHIMREVPNGWIIRYVHANTASFFFLVVYLHILRGFWYGSYIGERRMAWYIGVIIFLLMIITAFIGYTLVWGQMSLWGATVITNLVTTIPKFGHSLVEWLWGGFSVGGPTLNRFYSIHYLLPFILAGLIIAHLISLHEVGSSNPLGISSNRAMINFNPYFTFKDFLGFILLISFILIMVFYSPNTLGHSDNYIPGDPLVTPPHIIPETYLLPFYAILRSIPNKTLGVLGMLVAILGLLLLPSLHQGVINSTIFRPIYKILILILITDFLLLIWIGQEIVAEPFITTGQILTALYFLILFLFIPIVSFFELFLTIFYSRSFKI